MKAPANRNRPEPSEPANAHVPWRTVLLCLSVAFAVGGCYSSYQPASSTPARAACELPDLDPGSIVRLELARGEIEGELESWSPADSTAVIATRYVKEVVRAHEVLNCVLLARRPSGVGLALVLMILAVVLIISATSRPLIDFDLEL